MNRRSIKLATVLLAVTLSASAPAAADTLGRGEGGIVISDGVPIYKDSDGDRVMATCVQGDIVAAMSSILARDFTLVPIPSVVSQAQLQSIMTTQGNGGWRYHSAFAVGTGPIPTQEVLLFSRP